MVHATTQNRFTYALFIHKQMLKEKTLFDSTKCYSSYARLDPNLTLSMSPLRNFSLTTTGSSGAVGDYNISHVT